MVNLAKKYGMKKVLTITLLLILIQNWKVVAQTTEESSIQLVIQKVFTAMHTGDTLLLKSAFADEVTMATVLKNKEGKAVVRRELLKDFIAAVGQPQPEPLTEEIWNIKVQIDGGFAQAWCDYAFYVGKRFNHCGVDAFQLYKADDGWKIFHLADTRRKDGCAVPEEIQKKYK
jgi:hypothetical protein